MTDTYTKAAQEIFKRVNFMAHLNVQLDEVTQDTARMSFIVDETHGNYMGGLHGGAVAAVVDTVVFFPGCLLPSGRKLTTEGVEIHFFRPAAMGERITVDARVIRNGKKIVNVEARADNAEGKQIAHALVTLFDMEG